MPVEGHTPAPPPTMRALAARAADDASFVVEVKQGMPPEFTVPLTVTGKARLAALGVAQVPSPRQNVVDEALVPLFRSDVGIYAPVPVMAEVIAGELIEGLVRVLFVSVSVVVAPTMAFSEAPLRENTMR